MKKKFIKKSQSGQQPQKKINPLRMLKEKRERSLDEELEDQGVVFFKPTTNETEGTLNIDSTYLVLPMDLTDTTSKELGRYLNAYTQQRIYIRTLIGWQQLVLEQAKRKYYEVSTPVYNTLTKKDFPSETSKERFINNHPQIKDTFFEFRDEQRKLDLLYLNLNSIDDAIFLISREISRRVGDFDTERRNDNVQRS